MRTCPYCSAASVTHRGRAVGGRRFSSDCERTSFQLRLWSRGVSFLGLFCNLENIYSRYNNASTGRTLFLLAFSVSCVGYDVFFVYSSIFGLQQYRYVLTLNEDWHCSKQAMYVRFIVARRALPCAARASWTSGIQAEPAAPASSKCYTRQYATQPSSKATTTCTSMLSSITSCSSASGTLAVALAAMFACLSTSKDDASVCEREKILWVEAYGKKVNDAVIV